MNEWLGLAATAGIGIAILTILITPTKYGIWSKYWVTPAPYGPVLRQGFYVFGFYWTKAWIRQDSVWLYPDKGHFVPVSKARAQWLDNKLAAWKWVNGQ